MYVSHAGMLVSYASPYVFHFSIYIYICTLYIREIGMLRLFVVCSASLGISDKLIAIMIHHGSCMYG